MDDIAKVIKFFATGFALMILIPIFAIMSVVSPSTPQSQLEAKHSHAMGLIRNEGKIAYTNAKYEGRTEAYAREAAIEAMTKERASFGGTIANLPLPSDLYFFDDEALAAEGRPVSYSATVEEEYTPEESAAVAAMDAADAALANARAADAADDYEEPRPSAAVVTEAQLSPEERLAIEAMDAAEAALAE